MFRFFTVRFEKRNFLLRKPNRFTERLERAKVMLSALFGLISRGAERRQRGLEGGVVGDLEPPVRAQILAAVLDVTVDECEQVGDFFGAGLVRPQPSVLLPIGQGHPRLRSRTLSVL